MQKRKDLAFQDLRNPLAAGGNHLLAQHGIRSAHVKAVVAAGPHMKLSLDAALPEQRRVGDVLIPEHFAEPQSI